MARQKKSKARGRVSKKTSRKAALAKAARAKRLARRSKAAPERGKIHYLLRNIPRGTWEKFKSLVPDARFDLLTYVNSVVEKSAKVEMPEAEPVAEETVIEAAGGAPIPAEELINQ